MRKTLAAGALLAVTSMVVVLVSSALDLELESVALLGVALGAVVALVADRGPFARLLGFIAGFVIGWLGYVVRAGLMPDSASGRAVAVGITVLLCVAVAAATKERLPLWSALLGAAAVAGAYEYTYAAAPPELASTSVSTATSLLLAVAVGFLAAAPFAPAEAKAARPATTGGTGDGRELDGPAARLDDMMETTR